MLISKTNNIQDVDDDSVSKILLQAILNMYKFIQDYAENVIFISSPQM